MSWRFPCPVPRPGGPDTPGFRDWGYSGGPSKSMYSEITGISETSDDNLRYVSSSRFIARCPQLSQLKGPFSEDNSEDGSVSNHSGGYWDHMESDSD